MKKSVSKTLLSNMEISSFCSQMAMILQSGISSFEGISMLLEDSSSPAEKKFLQKIHDTLTETGNFTLALESSGVFPDYAIHMTELGEQSGKLDEVMNSLTLYYEREEHISRSIKSAVSYPLLMIGMMTAIVFILLTKVLPVFNQVFAQFGQEMTGFSGSLLHMGTLLSRYTVGVVVFFFLLAGLILFFSKTSQGKKLFMKFCYHMNCFKIYYDLAACCRFAGGMALTLSSGLNPEQSIELVEKLLNNPYFSEKIKKCKELMLEGCEFSSALTRSDIFSGMYGRIISIASRTGNMDSAMKEIAAKYEDDLDARLTGLIAMLEPTLVIILSVIVGFILLSVMLPLMGIMSGL